MTQPIGMFDSGVGGTSIWKEIHSLLPFESTIYLADSKNAPYGPKGEQRIIELSVKNTEFLIEQGCKLIVVACNTATTNAISFLRESYDIPFIGIEPAIKPAALNSKTKSIGILATRGTLSSDLFHKTTDLYSNGIRVIEQEGEGIVELIESGQLHSDDMKDLLQRYLEPMIEAQIDHLVLGCTHYAYLIPLLSDLIPNHINIIDSGEAVAKQTKAILLKNKLLNDSDKKSVNRFLSNADTKVLSSLLEDSKDVSYCDF